MTDYLEPITENGSDALWEAEQRLAAALAGLEELYQRSGKRTMEKSEQFTERAVMDGLLLEVGQTVLTDQPLTKAGPQAALADQQVVLDSQPMAATGHQMAEPTAEKKRDDELEDAVRLPLAAAVELLDLATERGLSIVAGEGTERGPGQYAGGSGAWSGQGAGKSGAGGDGLYASRGSGAYAMNGDSLELSGDGTQEQKRSFPFSEYGRPTDIRETTQAERLDQLFRRDSRRYDGGFFLY